MNHRRARVRLTFALLTAVVGLGVAAATTAATSQRTIAQVGAGMCGANNPNNEHHLRRLPTGLRNVGSATVSVVCTQWGDDGTTDPAAYVEVFLRNHKSENYNVTCTLTMGTTLYTQVAHTQTAFVPGADGEVLHWDMDEYGTNEDKQWANLQCSLPPGLSLEEIHVRYNENVGN